MTFLSYLVSFLLLHLNCGILFWSPQCKKVTDVCSTGPLRTFEGVRDWSTQHTRAGWGNSFGEN